MLPGSEASRARLSSHAHRMLPFSAFIWSDISTAELTADVAVRAVIDELRQQGADHLEKERVSMEERCLYVLPFHVVMGFVVVTS